MYKNIKIKYKALICFFFALYAVYIQSPFFTWSTFMSGMFGSVAGLQISTGIALLGILLSIMIFFKRSIIMDFQKRFLSLLLMVICVLNVNIASDFKDTFSFLFVPYLAVLTLFLLPQDYKIYTYNIFRWIFTVSLIIPIIIFVLTVCGIEVPYSELQSYEIVKQNIGVSYKLYPFAITRIQKYQPAFYSLKLCGIYDEPGRVGTLCGLILTSEQFKLKKRKSNIILLIAGVMTFSLAFYFIIGIYFVIKGMVNKQKGIFIILSIVAVYIIFINFPFTNSDMLQFQMRFKFANGTLVGDNRTNESYMNLVINGFGKNLKTILFGQGAGSLAAIQAMNTIDGSSFYSLLYDYGIVGFFAQIIWIILYCLQEKTKRIYCLPILFIYLANMYQRPSMFSFTFMLVLFGGIETIKSNNITKGWRGHK